MYPILLFDGDCAFCTASVNVLRRHIRPRAQIIPWQHADLDPLGVTERECQESIQWFATRGARPVTQGRAVAAAFRCGAAPWPLVGRVMLVPGIIQVMNAAYRLVAANRFRLPGSTPACRLPDPAPAPLPGAVTTPGSVQSAAATWGATAMRRGAAPSAAPSAAGP